MYIPLVSTEAIDHQFESKLGMDLEIEIENLRKNNKQITSRVLINSNIAKIVKKHTNLKIYVALYNEFMYTSVMVSPDINRNNPLFVEWRRKHTTSAEGLGILQAKKSLTGQIDLANSKVHGIFKEFRGNLLLGKGLIEEGVLTAKEMTGLILHEIGHLITGFEMLARTVTTNYVITAVADSLINTTDKKKTYELIDLAEEAGGFEVANRQAIINAKDKMSVTAILITDSLNTIRGELGVNIYDQRGWEQLSDQFAARHGYGKEVVSAVSKINRLFATPATKTKLAHYRVEIFKASIMLITPPGLMFLIIGLISSNPDITEYDRLIRRFEVIKNDLIAGLKVADKEYRKVLLDDINEIDNIISRLNDNTTFFEAMWRLFRPWIWGNRVSVKFQQRLEDLANNKLFLASAKLNELV